MWGDCVVLVAAGDESQRRTYREWLGEEYHVRTAADRAGVRETVGSLVEVVLAGRGLLEHEGLGVGTLREATDGCQVVRLGADETPTEADVTMADPTPERLVRTTQRLLIEAACTRILAKSVTLAERKARLEQELGVASQHAVEEHRVARERFEACSQRLNDLVQRAEFEWSALFDGDVLGDSAGDSTVGRDVE